MIMIVMIGRLHAARRRRKPRRRGTEAPEPRAEKKTILRAPAVGGGPAGATISITYSEDSVKRNQTRETRLLLLLLFYPRGAPAPLEPPKIQRNLGSLTLPRGVSLSKTYL